MVMNSLTFFNFRLNVDQFYPDIWGKIVGVSRLLLLNTTRVTEGIATRRRMHSHCKGGAFRTRPRPRILRRILISLCANTAKAYGAWCTNQICKILYGLGTAFVLNTGPMASANLTFTPTAINSGVTRVLDMSVSYQTLVLITTETPGGVGITPDCSKIAS